MAEKKRPRGNPAWHKGMKSPNPIGRPRGAAGLAKYAREQTRNGKEMIDLLLEIARGKAHTVAEKREKRFAADLILDRAFGKAPVVQADVGEEAFPLQDVDDDLLETFIEAGKKLMESKPN